MERANFRSIVDSVLAKSAAGLQGDPVADASPANGDADGEEASGRRRSVGRIPPSSPETRGEEDCRGAVPEVSGDAAPSSAEKRSFRSIVGSARAFSGAGTSPGEGNAGAAEVPDRADPPEQVTPPPPERGDEGRSKSPQEAASPAGVRPPSPPFARKRSFRSIVDSVLSQSAGDFDEPAVPSEAPEPKADPEMKGDPGTGAGDGILNRARNIKRSSPAPENVDDEEAGVISVDELGHLADLILPKSATFDIDELQISRNIHHFEFAEDARVASEFDDIFSRTFSATAISEAAEGAVAVPDDTEQSRFGRLRKVRLPKIRQIVEEYDPAVHGPLVDLSFRPPVGVEEIEAYAVNEPYAYIRVIYDSASHEYTYTVIEPVLNPAEMELLGEIKERLFETLDISARDMTRKTARKALRDASDSIIGDYGIKLSPAEREKILYNVEREFLGDGLIDAIMHDKYIEDISCDGVNSTIFVYHTTYESMKTSLSYRSSASLDSFVTKLAQRAGKYISIAEPMLDATMGDGSRIQMTLGSEVTAHGSTFTIRKFREEPITPTDLIEWHTFSPLGIAFLWLAVESGKSCIFAGGTASGKTTTLNAISLFIPPMAKIVTLEDTRELKLPHPNWIPSITRDSFASDGRGEIDMYELLRAALRQRPEYILVGEVRGKEALTLFQAMSTGHVTYATMHADSVASAVHRLENPPISVPRNMLSALNLISIQVQGRVGGQRIRRNKQLIEVLDIDPRTNELITNEVFRWHPSTDEIRYSGKSYILEQIMEDRGWGEERMREELKRRQEVLEWMRLQKIRHYTDVSKILISYFRDPEAIIQRVRTDLYGEGGGA
ncbi:secretion system protein E [Methanoculleus sp. FWC-SCC1]|uniref:Secretion system protein E n=2 Tax=Methanoculleus frigidifontis TaxID=2584085 RepID=A0ABT8MB89_9EURY|nr:secretion system protein E [Methanoculleus sp. FWC-SCC1]